MAKWNIRSPDAFPAFFASTMETAVREFLLGHPRDAYMLKDHMDKASALRMADQFRWFRMCVREKPLHRLHSAESTYKFGLKCVPSNFGHALYLTIRKKPSSDNLLKALQS